MLIDDASRFARDLVAQELSVIALIKLGMRVLIATDDLTNTDDPMKVAMPDCRRFARLDKARLLAKLNAAREAKGKLGGCKATQRRKIRAMPWNEGC